MKLQDYNNKKTEYGIEGTGIDVTSKLEKVWKDKVTKEVTFTIPAGSRVHIDFSPKKTPQAMFITFGDEVKFSRTQFAPKYFTGFKPAPSLKTLEKWSYDSVSKTVTGRVCEPDGYSFDGSPSWLLVFSLI